MNFKQFLTDKVTLLKIDGSKYEDIDAGIQSKLILISDASLPIEPGDKLTRLLPSGVEEVFVITDPGFHQKFHGIEAHYQARYEREGVQKPRVPSSSVTYNLSGPHARVNVNSVDQSINAGDTQFGAPFDQLRTILQDQIEDASERKQLLAKVEELQRAQGTDKFPEVYKEFMALAANHMTVLAPLLPALTALL